MSNQKTRVAKLEKQSERSARFSSRQTVNEFLDAHSRGMVLCRDGQARPVEDWLKTLAPDLANQIRIIGETTGNG